MSSLRQSRTAARLLDLTGEWIGYYPGHFDEVISIEQKDGFWVATKVTGDDYVPAGEVSWLVDGQTLQGRGQIAGYGFRDPTWIPGSLTIQSPDRICFTWNFLGSVEYRRDA